MNLLDRLNSVAFGKIVLGVLICLISINGIAQTKKSSKKKERHFAFYGGVGPNYYFNNLEVGKDAVNELNYSFVGRFMWEPEYLISLGIETGYNRLYSATYSKSKNMVHIVNVAIPIQVVISMKFLKKYYCNFSMGQSILLNQVEASTAGDFNASTLSLGDFGLTIGYKRPVSERFFLGAELKGFYSSKLDDKNIALAFMAGFRF